MDKWRCTPYLWITLRCPSRGKLIWHWNIFWKIVFSTHIKWPVPSGSSGFHSISDVPMYNMTNSCVINICFFRWFRCVFPASPGIHPKATPYCCWRTENHGDPSIKNGGKWLIEATQFQIYSWVICFEVRSWLRKLQELLGRQGKYIDIYIWNPWG